MKKYIEVTFIIQPDGGQYSAVCQEFGTASCGDSVEEASANLAEAIGLHLETLESLGEQPKFFEEHGISVHTRIHRPTPVHELTLPNFKSFITKNSIPVGA